LGNKHVLLMQIMLGYALLGSFSGTNQYSAIWIWVTFLLKESTAAFDWVRTRALYRYSPSARRTRLQLCLGATQLLFERIWNFWQERFLIETDILKALNI